MKGLPCRVFGHHWKHTISHGESREDMCTWCKVRQVSIDGVPLAPEESERKSAEMWRYAEGIMYLLDNVEPTCAAGRDSA